MGGNNIVKNPRQIRASHSLATSHKAIVQFVCNFLQLLSVLEKFCTHQNQMLEFVFLSFPSVFSISAPNGENVAKKKKVSINIHIDIDIYMYIYYQIYM